MNFRRVWPWKIFELGYILSYIYISFWGACSNMVLCTQTPLSWFYSTWLVPKPFTSLVPRSLNVQCWVPYYPAYKYMWLQQEQLIFCNFSSWKCDGYKHIYLCWTIIIKGLLETCYSMISRPNKTRGCKLNLSYLNNLSKFCLEFGISDTQ